MPAPNEKKPEESLKKRIGLVGVVLVGGMAVLSIRLWELQIVRWAEFRAKSEGNRLRIQPLQASRGLIYGRDGADGRVVLAGNRQSRDLVIVPADCDGDAQRVCETLETFAGIDAHQLLEEIRDAEKAKQPYRQILVKRDVSRPVLARVEEYAFALPGVITVVRPQRYYPWAETGGQVMGYLNEINAAELQVLEPAYRMGDLVGRAGLEATYEGLLHGADGHMLVTKFSQGRPQLRTDAEGNVYVEVDNFGHSLIEEETRHPEQGGSLFVNLDVGLQRKAEELLERNEGAIVVLEAFSGEVLCLASTPGYDPGVFVTAGTSHLRTELLQGKRMVSRAYQEVYPPGSLFKILLASAALETGTLDLDRQYFCNGSFRLTPNSRPKRCWKHAGHGWVNVVDALAFSCDVFFYNVGIELGVDRIHEWAGRLGFGEKSGLDLPNEIAGRNPSREWWKAELAIRHPELASWDQDWFPGDTLNLAIGQGSLTATPLQNAVLMAAIVNGGYRVRPYLNRAHAPRRSEQLLSGNTLGIVRRGLQKCVEKGPPAPTGTGHEAAIEGMTIIGKTGSAQVVALKHQEKYESEEDLPKAFRDHAWFAAGVIDREPALAICVLVEHGHHGSSAAAPLARELIEYYYASRQAPAATVLARSGGAGT